MKSSLRGFHENVNSLGSGVKFLRVRSVKHSPKEEPNRNRDQGQGDGQLLTEGGIQLDPSDLHGGWARLAVVMICSVTVLSLQNLNHQ